MGRLLDARSDDWVGLSDGELPVVDALRWAVLPRCGAVVLFTGTVRDYADGRTGVSRLEYEAFEEEVTPRLAAIAGEARRRWPELGRLAILHRVGALRVGEDSVVVVASAPHRAEAFDAARFAIDMVKTTAPIWKRETWDGGEDWSAAAHPVGEVSEISSAGQPPKAAARVSEPKASEPMTQRPRSAGQPPNAAAR